MKRILVANRGEIAVRILCAARELDIHSVAIYCKPDTSHISFADEAIAVPGSSSFLDIEYLVKICKEAKIDALHPGYGFLSESADFASKLSEAGVAFIGPKPNILEQTGNKLRSKELAEACHVPVVRSLRSAPSWRAVAGFANDVGYPVMLKAVDGGGGRGIRLVRQAKELEAAFERAAAESPSNTVFVEKALIEGWRHVEIQILGDGSTVRHFWERECSIQRRYQKLVELAPSMIEDRALIGKVIESAISIAKHINYSSLGTFEFLVSPSTGEYFFMEINPRLQVEHTVTETICCVDLVQIQLLVASGRSIKDIGLSTPDPYQAPPPTTAIQLRVTAEDVRRDFALSPGRINEVIIPRGSGVRTDTHIERGTIVSTDFDSLLLKIITEGSNFDTSARKGLRALQDLRIVGVTTNADLLAGVLASEDFRTGHCDTQWLEKHIKTMLEDGAVLHKKKLSSIEEQTQSTAPPSAGNGSLILKKGDAWEVSVSSPDASDVQQYHISVNKLSRNDFPNDLRAEVTIKGANSDTKGIYGLSMTQSSSAVQSGGTPGSQKRGNANNPAHLICPLSGDLVEMLVDEGDEVDESDAVAIIRQMKMELEVRAHRKGKIQGLWDVEDGDSVDMGALVCEIEDTTHAKPKL